MFILMQMLNKPFKLEKIATLANFLPYRVTVVLTYNLDQNKIMHSFPRKVKSQTAIPMAHSTMHLQP